MEDGTVVNCIIYDTPSQERFYPLLESYYRKADAILLVYDISNKESFNIINDYYIGKIKELCKQNLPVLLLGNMADKEHDRQISKEEGNELAKKKNFIFKECSCLKNENVDDAFWTLIEKWNLQNKKKMIEKIKKEIQKEIQKEIEQEQIIIKKYSNLARFGKGIMLKYIKY